jgi:AcrR family transcriptional regulator
VARPNRSDETRERIIDAALALVDAEGLEMLSLRRLAADLEIRSPTLYHYFASKTELLDAVAGRISNEIWDGVEAALATSPEGDWEAALRGYVDGAVTALARHPRAVGFLALRPVSNQRTLAGYETMLTRLTACGWPLTFAWQAFLAAENLVLAAALEAGAPPFWSTAQGLDDKPLMAEVIATMRRDRALDSGSGVGLDALIEGLAEQARTRTQ